MPVLRKMLLLVALLLATSAVHAQDERLHVIASFTILADVAQNVAGDAADVSSLIPVDADPHAFTPAPSNLAAVTDADVVLISGINLEAGLLEAIEGALGGKTPVVASSCVPVLPFGQAEAHDHEHEHEETATAAPESDTCAANAAELAAIGAAPPAYETLGRLENITCAGDEHDHDHEAEGEDEHEAGSCDPHVWFNPYNVQLWALTIRDELSAADPVNAATYAANTTAYVQQLESLKSELDATLSPLPQERRVLVTDHEALGYFASSYGFTVVGLVVPGVSTAAEPSAVQIAQLIDTIRTEGVPAVFAGVTVSPQLAEQVATDAGAAFYTLYTESLSAPDGAAPTYLDFMRYNMQTIVAALS
jgi:zinc/manganese transport system substrate-binding protein